MPEGIWYAWIGTDKDGDQHIMCTQYPLCSTDQAWVLAQRRLAEQMAVHFGLDVRMMRLHAEEVLAIAGEKLN